MDLSNLSNSQVDTMQRRQSLSSMSSSGLSSYNNTGGNNTPKLSNQRLSKNLNLQNPWNNQPPANVAPWVEQQQHQQQALGLDKPSDDSKLSNGSEPSVSVDITDGDLEDDDELIPTAIVIKNIPFAIKKEQLLDVMTKLNLPLPYAFNYHFDNGVFRGLAFANFTSTDETSLVVNQLNGREIGGRKLRVEYKKMLPAQERERIEREKREKRGQLEEQHRSTSTASLASLISQTSTTAATKNLSVNGNSNPVSTTERVFISIPFTNNVLPTPPPMDLNFNDPETLELYTQLILYRDDTSKSVYELAFTANNLSISLRKLLSSLCSFLNLLELFDNGFIVIRRKPGHVVQSIAQQQSLIGQIPTHSSSMMNLNQLNQLGTTQTSHHHPELLRSHSQSALPLPRLRNQASTPIQQHFPQYQQTQQQGSQQNQQGRSMNQQSFNMYQQSHNVTVPAQVVSSTPGSASLLRTSNRSYVDMRVTTPLSQATINDSPTPQSTSLLGQQSSQPGTPLATPELSNRFQPFGQHQQLQGSFTNLHQSISSSQLNEFGPGNDILVNKLNSMNLNNNYDSNSGIWGPK